MQNIGDHGLTCPDGSDYAALALYMQCQAEAIDTTLGEQRAAFAAAIDRPTMILRAAANVSVAATSALTEVQNFFGEVVFLNNSFMQLVTTVESSGQIRNSISLGSTVGILPVIPYLQGFYMAGASVGMDADGAVTAFSSRSLTVSARDTVIPTTLTTVNDTTPDANTAITVVGCNAATSFIAANTNGISVFTSLGHNNATSNVTFQAGALFWVTYVGPLDLVEVS